MIALVFCFYIAISSYQVTKLWHKGLKKEIVVYLFIMSISFIISSLVALNIKITDPMIYLRKFLEMLKGVFGGEVL